MPTPASEPPRVGRAHSRQSSWPTVCSPRRNSFLRSNQEIWVQNDDRIFMHGRTDRPQRVALRTYVLIVLALGATRGQAQDVTDDGDRNRPDRGLPVPSSKVRTRHVGRPASWPGRRGSKSATNSSPRRQRCDRKHIQCRKRLCGRSSFTTGRPRTSIDRVSAHECVQGRQICSVGDSPTGGTVRNLRSLGRIRGGNEADEADRQSHQMRMVSESPGRNATEPSGGLVRKLRTGGRARCCGAKAASRAAG